MLGNRKRDFFILLVVVVLLMILPLGVGEFYLYVVRLICIYTMLTIGLNIFMGYCGQINFGASGFFCIGAYIPTILQMKLGWHYVAAFPVGVITSLFVGWVVSWPLLRLRSHAMAIGTMALAMPIYLVFERFEKITGGSDGTVVPPMVFFGSTMGNLFYYYFILVFAAVIFVIGYFLPRWTMSWYRQNVPRLLSISIIRCAFFEAFGICGLILGVLGAEQLMSVPFLGVSLLAMILTFPTEGKWQSLVSPS